MIAPLKKYLEFKIICSRLSLIPMLLLTFPLHGSYFDGHERPAPF